MQVSIGPNLAEHPISTIVKEPQASSPMKSVVVNSLASAAVLFISVVEGQVVADPHRFDEAIEAFEAADRKSMPRKGDVLFLGSSSIRRWDTAAAFKGM